MSEHIYEDSDMEHERYHIISVGSMREEIVRCEDCIEYEPYHTYAGMKLDCGMCMEHGHETNDYRFCAWGTKAVSE